MLGFLGLKPVLVANENLVTQLSNFLGACGFWSAIGFDVVTSLEIEALTGILEFDIGVYEESCYCCPALLFISEITFWFLLSFYMCFDDIPGDGDGT